MRRDKDGCGLIFLIVALISGIISTLSGSPGFLLYILAFLALPLIGIGIGHLFSNSNSTVFKSPNKQDILEKTPISNAPPIYVETLKNPDYTFKSGRLEGEITKNQLPKRIIALRSIKYLKLTTKEPIEISTLINNNPSLNSIHLFGPFQWTNSIKNECQISHITLYDNPNINIILKILSEQQNIESLKINSDIELTNSTLIYCCRNAWDIRIRNKFKVFPIALLYNKNLKYLELSNNEISSFPLNQFLDIDKNELSLMKLDIRNNLLEKVPLEIFGIKSLKNIFLSSNPLSKKSLKELLKIKNCHIELSYKQIEKGQRLFHPSTWLLLKIIASIIAVAIPYLVFESGPTAILIIGLLIIFWRTK